MARNFARVVVMQGGRVIEQGDYDDLSKPGSAFSGLIAAE
jgi:ABC-type transport system involved in cytochrome bd biosynthesis fused ATPase/permease subunit